MQPSAKVVADSLSPEGVRLTSIEVTMHRWVLAEMNTHRVFSRNSASSRAIPVRKQLARIQADPAEPLEWASEQKGMQGGEELEGRSREVAQRVWADIRQKTLDAAQALVDQGLHKSLVNRLIEPHSSHTALITSTAWDNFFEQRCSPLAQPEIRVAAEKMRTAYDASEPQKLRDGDWHLPYVPLEEIEATPKEDRVSLLTKVSAARCARVSYLTQDGKRDMNEDMALYERLVTADPPHWSPLEHVATPWAANRQREPLVVYTGEDEGYQIKTDHLPRVGNLLGWRSLRTEVEAQKGAVTFR